MVSLVCMLDINIACGDKNARQTVEGDCETDGCVVWETR
jgi:hypothetical protein